MSSNLRVVLKEDEDLQEIKFECQGRTPEQVRNNEEITIVLTWIGSAFIVIWFWYLLAKWIIDLITR